MILNIRILRLHRHRIWFLYCTW